MTDKIAPPQAAISLDDIIALGDVDDALGDFYDQSIANTATATGVSERQIRDWIDEHLIGDQGFRSQTLQGPGPNGAAVLAALEDAHVLRAESRRGTNWYEIAHDRLVEPIQAANARWRPDNLNVLQIEARNWERQGRPAGLLMTGAVLEEARQWAEQHPDELLPADQEFLDASVKAHNQAILARRLQRRDRIVAVLALLLTAVAIVSLVVALDSRAELAEQAAQTARQAEAARAQRDRADEQTQRAERLAAVALIREARALAGTDPVLARALTRHGSVVQSAAYSPDGELIATGGDDGTVKVWDASSGQRFATLTGHTGPVTGLAFSPDSTLLVTASVDGTARVWDRATAMADRILTLHEDAITGVAFSPDGIVLATASADRTAKLWNTVTGEETATLVGHEDWVTGVAFSPDGEVLATASADQTAKLWDTGTGEEITTLVGHEDSVTGVAFSSDGEVLATASADQTAKLWDANSGALRRTFTSAELR